MAYAFNEPNKLRDLFGTDQEDNPDAPAEWHDPGRWWGE